MTSLTLKPSPLFGEVYIPPSKSMAHRAIFCAFLSEGTSQIDQVVLSDDIIATCRAVEALGADMDILESIVPGRKKLVIRGSGTINVTRSRINCKESGTTARFIIPVTRLIPDRIVIEGEGKLVDRPFDVYYSIFKSQSIICQNQQGKLPLTLQGKLKPGLFSVRGDISSQFISGLLLTLPLLSGDSVIQITTALESLPYIQMTLAMQKRFGIRIDYLPEENKFIIPGWQKYKAADYQVEGDWSQAAFWLAAGALGGPVDIHGLDADSLQGDQGIIDYLQSMGADIRWKDNRIAAVKNQLKGIAMDVSQCPDLVPILAVLGSLAEGETVIYNAARLRMKECDRLKAIATELKALGANITEKPDSLHIKGVKGLLGGRIYGWNDHRIVMSAAIASMACDKCVTIEGCEAVNKSYPDFWDHFRCMGGKVL